MNPATAHTYIRYDNHIYRQDSPGQWRLLHSFETDKRAKRWQQDQERKRPGSVSVEAAPPKTVMEQNATDMIREMARTRLQEINRLAREQKRDQTAWERARHSPISRYDTEILTGKAAAYVAPDRDGSSFLRERSKKRVTSRNARNTRATYGGS